MDTINHDPRKQSPLPLGLRWLHLWAPYCLHVAQLPWGWSSACNVLKQFLQTAGGLVPGKGAVFFIPTGQRSGSWPDQPGKQQRSLWANFRISQSLAWSSAGALGWQTVFLGDYFCFQPQVLLSRLLNGGLRVN